MYLCRLRFNTPGCHTFPEETRGAITKMKIGFTGTRQGLTDAQIIFLSNILSSIPVIHEFHHGDCVGADQTVHKLISQFGNPWIVGHPPIDPKFRAFTRCHETREPLPYLKRNHNIVDDTQRLLACPRGMNEVIRSGTWATIRYARKQNKLIKIIFPDGTVEG